MEVEIISLIPHSRNSRTIWCLFWSAQLACRREYFSMVSWTVVYILQGASLDPVNMQRNFWRTEGEQRPVSIWDTCSTQEKIHIRITINSFSSASPPKIRMAIAKHCGHGLLEHSTMKRKFKWPDANSKPCTSGMQVLPTNTTLI